MSLEQHLPPSIADVFVGAVLSAFDRAYARAAARFDPSAGCDGHTFGTDVWRFSWYELEREMTQLPGVETTRADSSFAISVGGVNLRAYRGGSDGLLGIDSFNFDRGSAIRRQIPLNNFRQLRLFDETDSQPGVELTIVHYGQPEIGCAGVWVGLAVGRNGDVQWEWKERLDAPSAVEEADESVAFDNMPEPSIELSLVNDIEPAVDLELATRAEEINEDDQA